MNRSGGQEGGRVLFEGEFNSYTAAISLRRSSGWGIVAGWVFDCMPTRVIRYPAVMTFPDTKPAKVCRLLFTKREMQGPYGTGDPTLHNQRLPSAAQKQGIRECQTITILQVSRRIYGFLCLLFARVIYIRPVPPIHTPANRPWKTSRPVTKFSFVRRELPIIPPTPVH